MADYMERRRVLSILHEIGGCGAEPGTWADGYDRAINEAYDRISREPTADVAPVVNGLRLSELEREHTALLADLKLFGGCMGCIGHMNPEARLCTDCDETFCAWQWNGGAGMTDKQLREKVDKENKE